MWKTPSEVKNMGMSMQEHKSLGGSAFAQLCRHRDVFLGAPLALWEGFIPNPCCAAPWPWDRALGREPHGSIGAVSWDALCQSPLRALGLTSAPLPA